MPQFFTDKEKKLTKKYEQRGYIIKDLDHYQKRNLLKSEIYILVFQKNKFKSKNTPYILNNFHKYVSAKKFK